MASNVSVTVGGTNIASQVIFSSARFETQMNAVPGTCSFEVKDPDQTLSFTTGDEIILTVDGTPLWGGYLKRMRMTYPFPADDTSSPSTYENRIWVLEGSDYNILWDSLILYRPSNYTTHVPNETGYVNTTQDGWVIWKMLYSFSDFPTGFNITSDRADATTIDDIKDCIDSDDNFFYKQQGSKLREQMEDLAKMAGATFYISADKKVHYHAYENQIKRWGFSDDPNYTAITASPADYQNADWGFHEVEAELDGTMLVNDALIWGGSPIGSEGNVIFARYQDATDNVDSTTYTYIQNGNVVTDSSIDKHGRWQTGEVHTEGGMYGNIKGVKARANVIINGPSGTSAKGDTKGLKNPTWQFTFSWWASQVPELSGVKNHIIAGDIVRISLDAFGVAQYAPCRTMRVSFVDTDPATLETFTSFNADFSYSYTDPTTLWKTLLKANAATGSSSGTSTGVSVTTAGNTSTTTSYGAFGDFTPVETPNGSTTVFTLPNGIGYIPYSLDVYLNGLIQRPDVDFYETNPEAGTFTMTSAPVSTDTIQVLCRTLST